MTLKQVEELLKEKDIDFSVCDFENEEEYLRHVHIFPVTKYAEDCRVKAIIIKCNNGYKNLELQFNEVDGEYIFIELLFGEFCFDMFENQNEFLANDLIFNIYQVLSEQIAIIVKNDLKKKRWLSDDCFILNEEDPIFGEPAFFRALSYIQRPKNFIENKLTGKMQYEIYTANSYQCIIR